MLSPFLILFCLQRLPFPPVRLYGFFTILTYLFAILWSLFLEEAGINIRLLGLATAYFLILLLMINNPKAQEVPSIPMAPSPSETTDAIQSLQTLSVHRLGKRAGLTTREGEILALLLQGRSTPYIAEVLFISKGTVKTHARHIYAKLQVHTKQELLDLAAIARKEN
jgi:DNA-binding CsgD family transcriptional regulator